MSLLDEFATSRGLLTEFGVFEIAHVCVEREVGLGTGCGAVRLCGAANKQMMGAANKQMMVAANIVT